MYLPKACAPDKATISWSLKPILLNTSRMWGAPLDASGNLRAG